ncbi:hypothetical protein [Acinetobacter tianfuensis]|nr:hypothetical protein [Acinetobacter tianfuensis]
MKHKSLKFSVLSIALTSLLTACGGGSGGSTETPFTPKTVSGTAVDFYLSGATVQFDNCKNTDGSFVTVQTNATGKFSFETTASCQNSPLTITGGIDIATGLNFTGTLKLKATDLQALGSGKVVVSPLTTLQAYAGSADIPTLLSNLGLSPETLSKLQTSNYDLSTFDPVTDASAKDMATIFVIQQLANQIEDSLQAVNNADGTPALDVSKATEIAFGALAKHLETNTLFTAGTAQISPAALTTILNTAVANANTIINDPETEIDNSVITQVNSNITTVSNLMNAVVISGANLTAEELQTKLQNNEGNIQDNLQEQLKTPVYSGLELASYTLDQLKNSSSANPLNIGLSQLTNNLSVAFKLENAKTELKDTIKLAFKLNGTRGTKQESLNVTVNNILTTFNVDGSIKLATIPQGAVVTITSTLNNTNNATFTLDNNIDVSASNGAISLQALIDSNATLKGYYNQFYGQLATNDAVTATAFVLPITYVVDSSLGLSSATVDFNGESFIGPSVTAYFKLN